MEPRLSLRLLLLLIESADDKPWEDDDDDDDDDVEEEDEDDDDDDGGVGVGEAKEEESFRKLGREFNFVEASATAAEEGET